MINFGPDTLPQAEGGGVIRWTGIGIKAPVGTPVKAVAAGKVVRVQRLSTYGLGVVVQHGNGYYSLYWQLQNASVQGGRTDRARGDRRNGRRTEHGEGTTSVLRDSRRQSDRTRSDRVAEKQEPDNK